MALVIILIPLRPIHIEAEFYEPSYIVTSGKLVDQPIQHKKITEPSFTEACNCYKYVKNRINIPRMAAIIPNSDPLVGGVAVEFFGNIKHISLITKVESGGIWVEESNYNHCETGERYIPYSKPSLVGFWSN